MTADRHQRMMELSQFRQALQTLRTGTTHLKHLLRVLYDRASLLEESWDCWVSKQALAAELEVSVKTVERSMCLGEGQGFFLITGYEEAGKKYCFRLRPAEIRDQWRQQAAERPGGIANASLPGRTSRRPGGIADVAGVPVEGRSGGIANVPRPRVSRTDSPLPSGTVSPDRETLSPPSETVSPEKETLSPKNGTGSLARFGQVGIGGYKNSNTNLANRRETESLGSGVGTHSLKWPEISASDLADPRTIERLYQLALARQWVRDIDRLRVFTAAVSIRRRHLHPDTDSEPIRVPGAAFTKVLKRKCWVGGESDEDMASTMLATLDQPSRLLRSETFEEDDESRRREEQVMALATKGQR